MIKLLVVYLSESQFFEFKELPESWNITLAPFEMREQPCGSQAVCVCALSRQRLLNLEFSFAKPRMVLIWVPLYETP